MLCGARAGKTGTFCPDPAGVADKALRRRLPCLEMIGLERLPQRSPPIRDAAMKRPLLSLAALACALASSAPAFAQDWRFCIGVAPASHEAVITDVFASGVDSAQLEHRFESYFRARKSRTLTFQCPRGGERLEALNAQTAALQFNRTMGFAVGSLPASEISAVLGAAM